jgi:ABC-type glycerol-3-phosphate transport system permease component
LNDLQANKLDTSQMSDSALVAEMEAMRESIKYSLIVVAVVPMLVIYPFVQKFFEKGVTMGSIKG